MKQLSIFVENTKGRLAYITRVLADEGIDIRAISVADTNDYGILRFIVNDPVLALSVLSREGIAAKTTDVLAVAICDEPKALSRVLTALDEKEVSVEYLYAFFGRETGKAYVILRVDNRAIAEEVLKEIGVEMPDTLC